MKRIILVAVMALIIRSVAMPAIYYMDSAATGAGTGLNPTDAWTTFQEALNEIPKGTHHDVSVAAGTYSETTYGYIILQTAVHDTLDATFTAVGEAKMTMTGVAGKSSLNLNNGMATSFNLVFEGIDIENTYTGFVSHLNWPAAATKEHYTFTNCSFIDHVNNTGIQTLSATNTAAANTRSLTLTDSDTVGKGVNGFALDLAGVNQLTLAGGSCSVSSDEEAVRCSGYLGSILIKEVDFTMPAAWTAQTIATSLAPDSLSKVEIYNCNITGGGITFGCYTGVPYEIYVEGNTIIGGGIAIGNDTTQTVAPVIWYSINSNTITRTVAGHGIMAGATDDPASPSADVLGGEVLCNYVDSRLASADFGIVCKTKNSPHIIGNIAIGKWGMSLKGVQGALVENNTCYGSETGAALQIQNKANHTQVDKYIIFRNNIFYSSGDFAIDIGDANTDYLSSIFEYNCVFSAIDPVVIDFNGATQTWAEWLTHWAANGTSYKAQQNGTLDLNVDPQLDSTFTPQNPDVISGGKPDVNGNETSIGAATISNTASGNSLYGTKQSIYGGN